MARSRTASHSSRSRKPHARRTAKSKRSLHLQTLEKRELLAGDLELIAVKQNSGALLTDGTSLSERPRELTFQFTPGEQIDPATLGAIQIIGSGGDGTFGDGNEVVVSRGFVGLGNSADQVVFRFGQSLADDRYQISILGSGSPLTNTAGTAFNDGIDVSQEFDLDLGATVQAVVPQPVIRDASGAITQLRDTVHVYFNEDPLDQASAEDPKFYRLIDTAGTLDPGDDIITLPQSVTYDTASRMAVVQFASDIPDGTFRLKIGTSVDSGGLITEATNVGTLFDVTGFKDAGFIGDTDGADDVDLYAVQLAAGDSLTITVTPSAGVSQLDAAIRVFSSTGAEIGSVVNGGAAGVFEMITVPVVTAGTYYVGISSAGNETYDILTGAGNTGGTTTGGYQLKLDATASVSTNDDNSSFATATSLGALGASGQTIVSQIQAQSIALPAYPSGADEPGHRQIPHEKHGAGSGSGVVAPGAIQPLRYYFPDQFSYGKNPQGIPLFNEITENQKDRAREIYEIFGDLYGVVVQEVPESPGGTGATPIITGDVRVFEPSYPVGISLSTVLISGAGNWGTSPFGGGWMGIALHEIGHNAIGLDHSYELPAVQGGAGVAEDQFPGNHDIVHGRRNHRPDATDIDMFRFDVSEPGTITAEIVAERLGSSSLLDSALKLYRQESDGSRTLIAQNDNYFSDDAYIELEVDTAGTYFLGVTSTGNTDYNPAVSDSGFGGISDGNYELKLKFQGASADAIVDQTGKRLDGDADGQEGGTYEFDFRSGTTLFVDKASVSAGAIDGSAANPFRNIDDAIASASAGDVIRVVANGGADDDLSTIDDNQPYLVGLSDSFATLQDGSTLDVPQDVLLQVDAGAVLKLQSTNINAGSSAQGVDRSGGAIQILGTPENNVILTAYGNDAIGGDSDGFTDGANSGDWGGIVFRNDSDFLASDITTNVDDMPITLNYVNQADISFGGGLVSVNGTQSAFTPIHLIDSRPTVSYNTIHDSAGGAISASPDSFSDSRGRIGPDIVGNILADNSVNGLVIRGDNATGANGSRLNATARFDDTDIVHVFTENLEIAGNPGGQFNPNNPSQLLPGGRLAVDPGVVVKLSSARIEGNRGSAHLIAEGTPENPVIFTSLLDDRYGAGGTFDTSGNGSTAQPSPGDWSGLVFNATSRASIDNALISYGGGESPISGGLSRFNTIEAHHRAKVRVANSVFNFNADGNATDNRDSRGTNQPATIFVRQAQPIIVNNVFTDNEGSLININAGAMISEIQRDTGRSTGPLDVGVRGGLDALSPATDFADNTGPLIRHNRLDNNEINAMTVRGGKLTTESVWDDTDIVHVLRNEIIVDHHHTYSGLQLRSGPTESLVVKLSGANAGFTADGVYLDIEDRIGGTVEVLGRPSHPVVLTSINDCTVGAGLTPSGFPHSETIDICVVQDVNAPAQIVDVVLLLDDTASFSIAGASIASQFPQIVADLQTALPNADFAFSVSRFEEYDAAGNTANSRPFILNQPVISTTTPQFQQAIDAALLRTAPSGGGVPDESHIEALWQISNGTGFDGNGDGDVSDSGAAGLVSTQINPTDGGDVPDFASFTADATGDPNGPVLPASGTIGGVGFRATATDRIVILATDGRFHFESDGAATYTGVGGSSVPASDFTGSGSTGTPGGLGATIQATVDSLVTNNIKVVGIGESAVGSYRPSLEALATLTGAVDESGNPLFFVADPNNASTISTGIVSAITGSVGIPDPTSPGDWRSLRFNQRANDRNVRTVLEDELANNAGIESNDNAGNAQSLGELAKDLKSGDDNRALGFEVHGFISADDSSDVDLYSFNVDAGTEVWIDLDRTAGSLDAVVELVQQDGTVLASSIGANRPTDTRPDLSGAALPLEKHAYDGGDFYTLNFQDPGFRVVLPGNVGGTNETYFVRVTSEGGLTNGEYQLQVRLRQVDEKPGSTVQFADIRYATNGIEVNGLPFHSILAGETGEAPLGNGTTGTAQELGNLLESDRNVLSVAGNLPSGNDVDTFHLNVDYATTIYGPSIQAIAAVSGGPKTWSTVFDVDYADGLTRSDTSLFVYGQDQLGNLVPVLVGRESNVADDQPGAGQGIDLDDLTRGSAGQLDPFIGPIQLNAGNPGDITDYYTAITSNSQLLQQLNQTYIAGADNPLVRLEPLESVTRVVEDHIGFQGYDSNGAFVAPRGGLIDISSTTALTPHIRSFDFGDIPLFVSSANRLETYNPLFGDLTTDLGPLSANNNDFHTQDIVFRSDGTLWGYQRVNGYNPANNPTDNGTAGRLVQLDPGTGAVQVIGSDNVLGQTPTPNVTNASGNNPGFPEITFTDNVDALAWERSGVDSASVAGSTAQYALYYSVRETGLDAAGNPVANSKLYRANPTTGSATKDVNALRQYGQRGDLQPTDVTYAGNNIVVDDGNGATANILVEARAPGTAGNGISVIISRADLTGNLAPVFVNVVGGNTIFITADDTPDATAQQITDAINQHPIARQLVTAGVRTGSPGESGSASITGFGPLTNGSDGAGFGPIGHVTGLSFGQFHGDASLSSNAAPLYGVTDQGEFVTINTSNGSVTNVVDLTSFGVTGFQGLSLGPQNVHGGRFSQSLFAITTNGELMVIDTATNLPVQAFGSDNEMQAISVAGTPVAGDSFTLSFTDPIYGVLTTAPITFSLGGTVSPAEVTNALLALTTASGISLFQAADLNVTGGDLPGSPIQIEFQGFYQDKPVEALIVSNSGMTGGTGSAAIATIAEGGDGSRDQFLQSTTATNPTGLALSPLDFNLWHPTFERFGNDGNADGVIDNNAADSDAGHGINPTFNYSRISSVAAQEFVDEALNTYTYNEDQGGISLYFGLSEFVEGLGNPYLNFGDAEAQYGTYEDFQRDLTDDTNRNPASNPNFLDPIGGNYNLPGGALGSLLTDPFDLTSTTTNDGASIGDRPTLYFNYFLDSEDRNTNAPDATARDTARVFISSDGGRNWDLVATNNTPIANSGVGITDSTTEVPDFVSHLRTGDASDLRHQIQPLFDSTGGWRQARVDLSDYSGQSGLRLRFDFSTAGTIVDTVVDTGDTGLIPATANRTNDADLASPVDEYGNLNDALRGQNNAQEGFYIDDIIIGWSERGEIITGATTNTNFFSVPQDPDPMAPVESLRGPYQLEIRRGNEHASIPDDLNPGIAISSTFDPNVQFVPGAVLGLPTSTDDFEAGDFSGLSWVANGGDSPWTVEDNLANLGVPRTFEAQSGPVDRGESSVLSVSVTTGEGQLKFRQFFTPDSPSDDRFLVFIDGEGLAGADWEVTAADTGFRDVSIPISAGPHSVEFVYRKLASGTDGVGSVLIDDIEFPSTSGGYIRGDRNIEREQGQFLIHGNVIRDVAEDAIVITAGTRGGPPNVLYPATNFPNPGSPINFETLNNQSLIPGVTVSNNVLARFGINGINVSGDPIVAGVPQAPVPLGKFINNTIYGSDVQLPSNGTTGIRVENNASPTLLNNLIVNTQTGVLADGSSSGTILARTYFRGNTTETTGVTSTLQITDDPTNQLFVDPLVDNFYLAGDSDPNDGVFDGALPIDRSLAKIDDRTAFVAVTSDLGIPESPFLSPTEDIFGQRRVDDANQPPSGVGSEVFNDVGAIERADFIGPFATMLAPLDNGVDDQDPANHDVTTLETNFLTRLIVQLSDSGIGVDDRFVSGAQWELKRNGQVLTEGADYTFIHNPVSDQITFQSVSIFPTDSRYTITLIDQTPETGIRDIAGNPIQANRSNGDVRFEVVLQNGVNDPPVNVTPGAQTTDEDVALVFNNANGNLIAVSDPDAFLGTNEVTITLTPTNGALAPLAVTGVTETSSGTVITLTGGIDQLNASLDGMSFIPDADYFGPAQIVILTNDNGEFSGLPLNPQSDTDTILITVAAVNDAPLIDAIADQTIPEDTTSLIVTFTGLAPGPANETEEVRILSSISSDPSIIPNGTSPTGSPGSIVFSPVPDAFGTVTITVTVEDAGADGDINTPADNLTTVVTFDIIVTPVNDVPTIDAISNVVINEDEGPGTINLTGIAGGPFGETEPVRMSVSTSSSAILTNAQIVYSSPDTTGTLTYDLLPDQFGGPTTVSINVEDAGPDGIFDDDPVTTTIDESADNLSFSRTFDVTVDPINDLPTIDSVADQTVTEDSGPHNLNLSGITTGAVNETQPVRVTATSSDPLIVPNPTINYTDPSTVATLSYQPAFDAFGSVIITVQVEDAGLDGNLNTPSDNGITFETFNVTVSPVNDAPQIAAVPDQSIEEDSGPGIVNLSGIGPGAANESETVTLSASITGGDPTLIANLQANYTSPDSTGTVTYDLVADAFGTVEVTLELTDAGLDNLPGNADDVMTMETFQIVINPVNDAPLLDTLSNQVILEDMGPGTINVSGIDNGPANESESVRITATSSDLSIIDNFTINYTSLDATGTIDYTLVPDAFGGPVVVTVTVEDAGIDGIFDDDVSTPLVDESADNATVQQTLTVTVAAVNDDPTLNANDVVVDEDSLQTTVSLTGISAGGGESQPLNVTATSDNLGLIPNPTVTYSSANATGSLAFTPIADAFGTATITVSVEDGGLDSNLSTLFDNNTFLRTFVVTVNPINDAPTLAPISDRIVDEDSASQDINLTGISAGPNEIQPVEMTATSNNPSLIPTPTINFDGTSNTALLSYQPLADQFGSATITVTITDGGADGDLSTSADNLSHDEVFVVTVSPVNDAPTISPVSVQSIDEDSQEVGIAFTGVTAGGGETQPVRITATSSDPGLVPDPTVVYADPDSSGELRVQPVADQFGSTVITITVEDAGLDGDFATPTDNLITTESFVINITPVNDPPTLGALADESVEEDSGAHLVALSGITAGENESDPIRVSVAFSNPSLIETTTVNYTSALSTGTFSYTPAQDQFGTTTVTVTVEDGGLDQDLSTTADNATFDQLFLLTVNPVNDNPQVDPISDLSFDEDSAGVAVNVTGITAGPSETGAIRVSSTSSNPGLIPDPAVTYTSPSTTAQLDLLPVADAFGTATITVTIEDAGEDNDFATTADNLTFSETFIVTVNNLPDSPVANDDTGQTDEDSQLLISAIEMLANDTDVDLAGNSGEVLSINSVEGTSQLGATITFDPSTGDLTYDPTTSAQLQALAPGVTLQDSFVYSITDADGEANPPTATVFLNVNGINDAPTVVDDLIPATDTAGPIIIKPTLNDFDIDGTLDLNSLVIVTEPTHGSLAKRINGAGEVELEFTPFASFNGADSFAYTIEDNLGQASAPAIVTLQPDQRPQTGEDVGGGVGTDGINVDVLANDQAVTGQLDVSSLTIVSGPDNGTATIQTDGTITYVPDSGYFGQDEFAYTIADTNGNVSQPVTVRVNSVASGLQNPILFQDVNANGEVTALDALLVINRISRGDGSAILVDPTDRGPNFYDVDGSMNISALDALLVINRIGTSATVFEGESITDGNTFQSAIATRKPDSVDVTASGFAETPSILSLSNSSSPQLGAWSQDLDEDDTVDQIAQEQTSPDDESSGTFASLADAALKDLF